MVLRVLDLNTIEELKIFLPMYKLYKAVMNNIIDEDIKGIKALIYIDKKYKNKDYLLKEIISDFKRNRKKSEQIIINRSVFDSKYIKFLINKDNFFGRHCNIYSGNFRNIMLREIVSNIKKEYKSLHGKLIVINNEVVNMYNKRDLSIDIIPSNDTEIDKYIEDKDFIEITFNSKEIKRYLELYSNDSGKINELLYLIQDGVKTFNDKDEILASKVDKDVVKIAVQKNINTPLDKYDEMNDFAIFMKDMRKIERLILYSCKWEAFLR